MKKRVITIFTALFLTLLCSPINAGICFANQEVVDRLEILKDSRGDYDEIVKLESSIIGQIKLYESMSDEKEKNNEEITIDFDHAIKIYTDVDIFKEKTSQLSKIQDALKDAAIVWDVMAYQGNSVYRIQISKVLPLNLTKEERTLLSESEIEEYEARVGEWDIAAVEKITDRNQDYLYVLEEELNKLGDSSNNNDKIILCGGLKYIGKPAAIIGNKTARIIVPLSELTITGEPEQIVDIKIVDDKTSHAYKYDEIKEAVIEMGEPEEGLSGANNEIILPDKKSAMATSVILVIVSVIFICTIVLSVIMRKKKMQKLNIK